MKAVKCEVMGKGANGLGSNQLNLTIEIDREADGRWIAEVPQLPGALV